MSIWLCHRTCHYVAHPSRRKGLIACPKCCGWRSP